MNAKRLVLLCVLLLAAAGLRADPDADAANWQFAQAAPPPAPTNPPAPTPPPITIPSRRVTSRSRTNTPAAFPAFPAPPARPARPGIGGTNITTANASATATGGANGAVNGAIGQNPATIPGMAATTAGHDGGIGGTNAPEDAAIYDFDFPSMPVDQLLDTFYAPLVGRTLLRATACPSAVSRTATITLNTQHPLTKKDAIIALETILGMNGITIIPIGDKFAKVVSEATAPQAGGLVSTNNSETNMPLAGKFITQIVQLKYADGNDLTDLLKQFAKGQSSIIFIKSTQTLILRDYSENVARMLELVKRIDVSSPLQVKPEVIPIKYALASDMASALTALGAQGGTSVGGAGKSGANFSTGAGSRSGGGFGNGGGFGTGAIGNTGFGGGGYGGYPGQSVGLQSERIRAMTDGMEPVGGDDRFSIMAANPVASGARSSFQQNLQNIVNKASSQGQFTLFGETKII